MLIGVCAAKVCSSQDQIDQVSFEKTIHADSISYNNLLKTLTHPTLEVIYFQAQLDQPAPNSSRGAIMMTDYDINVIRMKGYSIDFSDEDFGISGNGDYIYLVQEATSLIMEVNSTDLGIVNIDSISNLVIRSQFGVDTFGNKVFYSASSQDFTASGMCIWQRLTTSTECYYYGHSSNVNYIPISENQAFMATMKAFENNLYFVSINLQNPPTFNWSKYITCSSSCTTKMSQSIVSNNGKFIYSMNAFGGRLMYHTLDISTGNAVCPGLLSSGDSNFVNDINDFGDSVFVVFQPLSSSNWDIIIIDPLSCTVSKEYTNSTTKFFSSTRIMKSRTEYIVLAGELSRDYKILISKINEIERFSLLIQKTSTFSKITTDFVISDPGSIAALTHSLHTMIPQALATISSSDISVTTTEEEYITVFWNDDFAKSYLSQSLVNVSFIWACSHSSNVSAISFSLQPLDNEKVPNWVYLDSNSEILTLNKTPAVSKDTLYKFALTIDDGTESVLKKFYITVKQCAVNNCQTCQSDDPELCSECSVGYTLSDSKDQCVEADAQTAAVMGQSMAGVGVVISMTLSMATMSSPVGMFALINQFQLYILLPMLPPYFPAKVGQFILGVDFSFISFDFIPVDDIPLVKEIKEAIDYPQKDNYLNDIGLTSSSSIINYLGIMVFILFVFLVHALIGIIYSFSRNSHKLKKRKKIIKVIFQYMTFNFYIRLIIQGFMFHVISISAELKSFNYHSTVGLISLILCFFFSFGLFIFTVLAVASFVDGYENEHSEFHNHWSIHEFFSGIKKSKFAKFNSLCFLLVRFLSVLTIIMIGNATGRQRSEVSTKDHAVYYIKCSLFFVTYLSSTLYVLIVRPYESIVNNIIEGINQINFTLAIIPLVFLRFESDWSSTKEDIYMQSLLSGPMIGTLISIVPLIFLICNKCSSIRKKVHAKARTSTTMVKDLGNNENNQKMEGSCANSRVLIYDRTKGRLEEQQNNALRSKLSR
ncbi:unnamed protein product [Moneuplotes crassus]|uniref:Uncharacterized protein n=1 Tax=Euplotes crassus TaxID=5936 RepID=A0AAD2CWF6_EUPCR|nr:unnamed protein product [Moneuplotes crassus]